MWHSGAVCALLDRASDGAMLGSAAFIGLSQAAKDAGVICDSDNGHALIERWTTSVNPARVAVATCAFGTGIDRPCAGCSLNLDTDLSLLGPLSSNT